MLTAAHRLPRHGYWFLLCLALLTLSGCMSTAQQIPARYRLAFDAAPQANDALPVKVRVLLLRSDAEFMAQDFFSLQNDARQALGNSLIDSDQFFLTPGQQNKRLEGQSTLEIRYIGIIAEYQQLGGKVWRLSLPLPAPLETNFYKVWQFSPDTLEARLLVGAQGLEIAR
ncbi:type VI secretion system lipoprotein TssJ [Entomohabitans teleogrylli]|uniref:type VI secretion system lipoprotein TssJ n=1 Tax=Entomohabitans teleogrylli TaxID=1384589 RepID=UPI00073D8B72|nr:type VI secretion system lipoprotein TssJ [Entomohabitans teleogrylli]